MNKYSQAVRVKAKDKHQENDRDLMNFVAQQFKQLAKKNLQVPIQLYSL